MVSKKSKMLSVSLIPILLGLVALLIVVLLNYNFFQNNSSLASLKIRIKTLSGQAVSGDTLEEIITDANVTHNLGLQIIPIETDNRYRPAFEIELGQDYPIIKTGYQKYFYDLGLQKGDKITHIDEISLLNYKNDDIYKLLYPKKLDDVKLSILRDDTSFDVVHKYQIVYDNEPQIEIIDNELHIKMYYIDKMTVHKLNQYVGNYDNIYLDLTESYGDNIDYIYYLNALFVPKTKYMFGIIKSATESLNYISYNAFNFLGNIFIEGSYQTGLGAEILAYNLLNYHNAILEGFSQINYNAFNNSSTIYLRNSYYLIIPVNTWIIETPEE